MSGGAGAHLQPQGGGRGEASHKPEELRSMLDIRLSKRHEVTTWQFITKLFNYSITQLLNYSITQLLNYLIRHSITQLIN